MPGGIGHEPADRQVSIYSAMKSSGGEEPDRQRHALRRAVVPRRTRQTAPEPRALAHLAIAEQGLLRTLQAVIVQGRHVLAVRCAQCREAPMSATGVSMQD